MSNYFRHSFLFWKKINESGAIRLSFFEKSFMIRVRRILEKDVMAPKTPIVLEKDDLRFTTILLDILTCLAAAAFVAGSLFYFSNFNNFAPGGVTGLASILATVVSKEDITPYMSLLMLVFNLPIFILVSIFVGRKTGIMLSVYLVAQALIMMFLKSLDTKGIITHYIAMGDNIPTGNNLIYASIGVGVISGFGFSLMLRRFGASGGTYAITALIKKLRPQTSLAWFSFVLDASVVLLAVFVYRSGVNPVISTLLNIFISDIVVDFMLSGLKSGYKFEIITDKADELAEELMTTLGRGVTTIHAEGMYTHADKELLICIVRRRQVGDFLKILKRYKASFSYSCKVNEVYGKFEPHPQSKTK